MVILDQIITDNAPTIWYPKKLNGPPLKIPLNLLKPSLTSSSPNNPTAISPQIPPKKCTGTADTGSSTFSLTNNRVPEIIHYTYITYNYTYISYQKKTTQLPGGVLGNSHFSKFLANSKEFLYRVLSLSTLEAWATLLKKGHF